MGTLAAEPNKIWLLLLLSTVTSKPPEEVVEGFPKAFVASLKVLFEILDEDGDGLVHISEIERRWASERGTTSLPFGVMNGLRKATPKNGKLSFERFCGGLKMSLNSDRGVGRGREDKQPNTATVRPNNVVRPMTVRSRSAPQLPRAPNARPRSLSSNTDPSSGWEYAVLKARHNEDKISSGKYSVREDVKLKRRSAPGDINANDPFHPRIQQEESNHRHSRRSEGDYVRYPPAKASKPGQHGPGRLDSKPERAAVSGPVYDHPRSPVEAKPVEGPIISEQRPPNQSPKQKTQAKQSKRTDPRRHTVSNGIDYNLRNHHLSIRAIGRLPLKRMKQLEQERDVLLQGLEVAERSRDWYQRQLAYARQRHPGYSGNSQFTHGEDSPASGQQDRRAYRMSRILEINRQLTHLMENPEKDFPDHMNLAMDTVQPSHVPPKQRMSSTSSTSSVNSNLVAQLREQNRLLTKEVSQKSELITQLEKDKAALIRQLFEARGKKHQNHKEMPNNTTFI
ncbi:suppressor APC domain-containing protein 2-like [Acanthaster planci]|uniref:Suppressor APC domain-containing protein 2-like n=1 Tax=Acanthaster planci TaxID=133434 RepID=A0A8B7XZU6_ACAPL|nr:suppressor APC domain-containing protein 2-like [Acanthaster planci]